MKLKQFFPVSGPLQLEVSEVLQSTLLAIEILVLVKTTYPFKQMCKQKRVNVFFSLISGYYSIFCSRSLHSLSSKPCYSLINPFSISARKQRDFSLYKSSNLLSACQSVANLYNSWLCVTLLVKNNIFFMKICSVFWGWISNLVSPSSVAGRWRSNHLLGFSRRKLALIAWQCVRGTRPMSHRFLRRPPQTHLKLNSVYHAQKGVLTVTSFMLLAPQCYFWW